jgi:hypothetical protein
MRTPVSDTGILRSGALETTCTVKAIKVTMPGDPSIFEFCEFSIENVSKQLPEGIYQITAFGKTQSVRYSQGAWLAA